MTMKVKVIYGQDIRRWRYDATQVSKLDALREFVASSFGVGSFWLQYEDDEGDRLTLSGDTDFDDAFVCATQQQRISLKIYVLSGSLDGMHAQQQQPPPQRHAPPQSHENHDGDDNIDNPNHSFYELKEAALDFLTNEQIIQLLPELHRRIFEEIKKRKQAFLDHENAKNDKNPKNDSVSDPNNDKNAKNAENVLPWDSPDTIESIIREILATDAKFSPIVQHRLYRRKLQFMIPRFAFKVSNFLPFLLNFSNESIGAWIAHFTSVISHGLHNFNVFDDCDMSSCMPLLCCLMSQHGDCSGLAAAAASGFYDDCNAAGDGSGSTHWKVRCDSCLTSPIKGARFKCLKCKDFDLCGQCESFGKHDPTHPMLKFQRNAYSSLHALRMHDGEFMGLAEMLHLFGLNGMRTPPLPPHAHSPSHGHGYGYGYGGHHGHGYGPNWRYRHHHKGPRSDAQSPQCAASGSSWSWSQARQHHLQQQQHDRESEKTFQSVTSVSSNKDSISTKKKKVTAEFVTDVTLPDRTYYPLDTVLTKTWRMRNNGEYEWGDHVELVFFKGNESLSLEQRYQVVNASPGQAVEVSAVIKTPTKPGRYCSYYRLQRNGEYFGPRVWVDIFAVDEQQQQQQQLNGASSKKKKVCKKQQRQQPVAAPVPVPAPVPPPQPQQQAPPPANVNVNVNIALEDEQQFLDDIANAAVQDVVIEPQSMPQQQPQQPNVFMYQAQFLQLKAMGFTDDERIKAQLIEQQGNAQHVANRLLLM